MRITSRNLLFRWLLFRSLHLLAAALAMLVAVPHTMAAPLAPSAQQERVDLWGGVTLLSDPEHRLSWQEAAAQAASFKAPTGPYANLGTRADTVWLRVAVHMPAQGADELWWLAIDYPPLDVAELHVFSGGQRVHTALLGDQLLLGQRPAPTLMHTAPLRLAPGQSYELLLRVRSTGKAALLVPMSLLKNAELLRKESRTQMVQGLGLGLGLCIFFITLVRVIVTRELMYLWFALATTSTALFFTAYTGVATHYLWPTHAWLTPNAPALMMLLILAFGSLFVERSLEMRRYSPRAGVGMKVVGGAAALASVAFVLGWVSYSQAYLIASAIGMLPMLLAVPVAYRRSRAGDRGSQWTFVGWAIYGVGVVVFSLLSAGQIGATSLNVAAFQISSVLETGAWLMVLSVRAKEYHVAAEHARREHARVLQISQTDPLTGLLNRRGLQLGLPTLVRNATVGNLTAVYLIDLDGFKPINDTHGHDAGDELLIQMGTRLKAVVRTGDLVARLGGDEFVVVASQLRGEAEAEQVGHKLLACSQEDFQLAHATCHVGMTVGYAVAPVDSRDADTLVRRADNAMYGGKQAGKNCVRRAGAAVEEAAPGLAPRAASELVAGREAVR